MNLSLVKCFWRRCDHDVRYKWITRKNPGFLWVCESHFQILIMVHSVETIERGPYTTVKVLPEPEEEECQKKA